MKIFQILLKKLLLYSGQRDSTILDDVLINSLYREPFVSFLNIFI